MTSAGSINLRSHPSLPAALTQIYTYDGANRLKTAQESGSWSRVYDYDAYGNRWVESANHTLTFATPAAQLSGDRRRPAAYSGQQHGKGWQ
jgi:SH3-like domain-containing protein